MKNSIDIQQNKNEKAIAEAMVEQSKICDRTVEKLEKLNGHTYEIIFGKKSVDNRH